MAYFANSSEGDTLEMQCEDCLFVCPVYSAQMLFNYDQHGDRQEKLKQCLEILIDKNGVCQMKKAINHKPAVARKPKSKEVWEWFVKVMSLQQGGPK